MFSAVHSSRLCCSYSGETSITDVPPSHEITRLDGPVCPQPQIKSKTGSNFKVRAPIPDRILIMRVRSTASRLQLAGVLIFWFMQDRTCRRRSWAASCGSPTTGTSERAALPYTGSSNPFDRTLRLISKFKGRPSLWGKIIWTWFAYAASDTEDGCPAAPVVTRAC